MISNVSKLAKHGCFSTERGLCPGGGWAGWALPSCWAGTGLSLPLPPPAHLPLHSALSAVFLLPAWCEQSDMLLAWHYKQLIFIESYHIPVQVVSSNLGCSSHLQVDGSSKGKKSRWDESSMRQGLLSLLLSAVSPEPI